MSLPSQYAAAAAGRTLIAKRLPGSKRFVADHRSRAGIIAAKIWTQFQVGPEELRVKHLRWYLERATRDLSIWQRYRHWATVRVMVIALGHGTDWLGRLQGPWVRPSGEAGALRIGRPAKLPQQAARQHLHPADRTLSSVACHDQSLSGTHGVAGASSLIGDVPSKPS
jgi:hypothetical protein